MAAMVRFRFESAENELMGSPGFERWRYPLMRQSADPPSGLPSPFHSLSESQGRLLVVAKARSGGGGGGSSSISGSSSSGGRIGREELVMYLQRQDPFLGGINPVADGMVATALSDFNVKDRRRGPLGWVRGLFGSGDV